MRQYLLEAGEATLVIEIRVGDNKPLHRLGRHREVAKGREDRLARCRARAGVDEERLAPVAEEEVLEEVPRPDQRFDAPRAVGDFNDAHATSRRQ
jgi:hypothetical protein